MTPPDTALDAALGALRRGWIPVLIPRGQKAPAQSEWQTLRPTEEEVRRNFSGDVNVGILLGEASGGLIDVDCDVREACFLAARWLPPTDRIHGRPTSPRSHYGYVVSEP